MNDEIVFSELKELDLMEALKLWRISFNAGFSTNFNNPGSEDFWNSMGWTVIQDIKYLYKKF